MESSRDIWYLDNFNKILDESIKAKTIKYLTNVYFAYFRYVKI
jgi:hypothetical protein